MEFLVVSKHGARRCQQRGIPQAHLALVLRFGLKRRWHDGAFLYYLGERQVARALRVEPGLRLELEAISGTAVVVHGDSGQVATVFKERRGIRQIHRNYRGRLHACTARRESARAAAWWDWADAEAA